MIHCNSAALLVEHRHQLRLRRLLRRVQRLLAALEVALQQRVARIQLERALVANHRGVQVRGVGE